MMNTLSECVKEWMEKYKRNSVKPSTYDRLETSYKALQKYPIAEMDILNIKAEDIQNFVNQMVEEGYALSTIKKQFLLVCAFLKFANTEGLIPRPIYNSVKLPAQSAVKKKKREIECYTQAEQMALVKVLRTRERIGYGAAILMLEAGLRVGEALALTWSDVQWGRRAININKTLIRMAHKRRMEVQDSAKSFTSNRIVPLSKMAYEMLETMYKDVNDPYGYIFADEYGHPISYEAIRYQVRKACKEANVPYKAQHVFRHTFATNCYNRGADVKLLSKLLGHCEVSITFNTYIHLFGDALEELRSVVG